MWLWLTVLFANLAESVAEGRGKAQAASLRKTRTSTIAHRVDAYDGSTDAAAERAATTELASSELRLGDVVVVSAGELIPGDGDIVWGIATVDESAITGESAPVIRESGGDRSAVTGGTRVLSDRIVVSITSKPGETFVDRMIALVEGASRQKTPNEIALNILLASLSIVFVIVVLTLNPIASYAASPGEHHGPRRAAGVPHPHHDRRAAVGDRHRGNGPARAAQRPRDVGPRGRGRRRHHDAPARQDRHDHVRQPAGERLRDDAGRRRGRTRPGRGALIPGRSHPGGHLGGRRWQRTAASMSRSPRARSSCRSPHRPA